MYLEMRKGRKDKQVTGWKTDLAIQKKMQSLYLFYAINICGIIGICFPVYLKLKMNTY